MFERGISPEDVRHALDEGQTIERYPDTLPYASRLVLGWCGGRPLHVVTADGPEDEEIIVVTVYEPDPTRWEAGFTRRKTP